MTDQNDDDQVIDYLRHRGDVQVPGDLLQRATTQIRGGRSSERSVPRAVLSLAALAIVVVVVGLLVMSAPVNVPQTSGNPSNAANLPTRSPTSTETATELPTAVATSVVGAPFPSTVLGMPVITVAEASSLAAEGKLNGRDVAVGGWYFFEEVPCPYPGPYVGQLEDDCRVVAFADTKEAATVCLPDGSCQGFGEGALDPWIMTDTLGQPANDGTFPVPIVAIGHTNDPRAWQCRPGAVAGCGIDFVVDRVAWASGSDLAATPQAFNYADFKLRSAQLTLQDVSSALGADQQVLSAIAVSSDGVRSFDPRWNLTGSKLKWVVRSISNGSIGSTDPTRPVTVSLVDDASGQVVDTKPLALAAEYDPARLWVTAQIPNSTENNSNSILAFDRVVDDEGFVVKDGLVSGGQFESHGVTTLGPDLPLLLDPGTYVLTTWLEPNEIGVQDPPSAAPSGECSTQQTLRAGDDVLLSASYGRNEECTWSNEETPSFGIP